MYGIILLVLMDVIYPLSVFECGQSLRLHTFFDFQCFVLSTYHVRYPSTSFHFVGDINYENILNLNCTLHNVYYMWHLTGII